MFSNLFGLTCIRPGCNHKNPKGAEFCGNCEIELAFNRPAILDGNHWSPAADELAAFFRFKNINGGFFTQTLWVPAGMKAWVLQDNPQHPVLLLNEGQHTTQTLFERMNNFFRSAQGEVLIVKTGSLPVEFAFDAVPTAEMLALKAKVTLRLRVRAGDDEQRPDVANFRRHFMQQAGVVTAEQLTRPGLLGNSVLAALRSYIGARSYDDLAATPDLKAALNTHLNNQLGALLADLGLELVEPSLITLHHEKLDAQNRLQGELWLVRREQGLQQQHASKLNELYDAAEREQLRLRELELKRKQRAVDLDQQDADLAHAMRLRELDHYAKALAATTSEQAARMGAGDLVAQLEHEYAAKRRQREQQALGDKYKADDEQAQWRYLQDVVRIRQQTAMKLEVAQQDQLSLLQREQIKNELQRMAAEADIEHAKLLSDADEREALLRVGVEAATKARLRSEQLEEAKQATVIDGIALAAELKRVEASRLQRLEDALAQQRIDGIGIETDKTRTDSKLDALSRLVQIDHQDELNKLQREDARLEAELNRKIRDRQQLQADALQAKELELRQTSLTGSLPMHALVLLADDPLQIDALVKMATLQAHGQMSPEAILASSQAVRPAPAPAVFASAPMPTAPQGPSVDDRVRLAQQDERAYTRDLMREQRDQNTQFLGVIEKMAAGLRDVGVANAGAPQSVAPTAWVATHAVPPVVIVSPAPAAAVPPASASVLQQAFVTCPHCRSLNPPGGRFCTACGQPLA